ncbi:hypothetical protein D7I46_04390 [Lactococcus allomyrinae]|uniref:Uncharacterized protein n=1 Tax=Lactococcus allomyrinae TaxID=2419773 RepID=A0A387BGZ4_9LACT|nr:hypothetical protein D7I46_04390 [Lactococcus allomyrinae]
MFNKGKFLKYMLSLWGFELLIIVLLMILWFFLGDSCGYYKTSKNKKYERKCRSCRCMRWNRLWK